MASVDHFIRSLRASPLKDTFNPWFTHDVENDQGAQAPRLRRHNLQAYLSARLGRARWLLIAEAAGFRGAKFSGVAMTCERQLTCELLPHPRTSHPLIPLNSADRALGVLEPTAMIVSRALLKARVDPRDVVLWNTYAWHPHKPAARLTNRTPTPAEVTAGLPVLRRLISLFPNARIIAIGKTAQRTLLDTLGLHAPALRHPANGGATEFTNGLAAVAKQADNDRACVDGAAGR